MGVFYETRNHIVYFVFNEKKDIQNLSHALDFFKWQMENIYYDHFNPYDVIVTGYDFGGYIGESLTHLM